RPCFVRVRRRGHRPSPPSPAMTHAANPSAPTSYHGEVWTDARGFATVRLPAEAGPLEPPLAYELRDLEPASTARVTAELRNGRLHDPDRPTPHKGLLADQPPKGGVAMSRTIALKLALEVVAAGVLATGPSGAS